MVTTVHNRALFTWNLLRKLVFSPDMYTHRQNTGTMGGDQFSSVPP